MTLDVNKTDEKLLTTIQQEYKILAEYKMIQSEKVGGVYVIPSYGNSLLWYGVIFVRQGFYKNAVFRFTILLPDKFPDDKTTPTVIFQTEAIHPLICPYTGTLDISYAFPQWRTAEDHIWQLLKYIKAVFIDPVDYLNNTKTCSAESNSIKLNNQEAADLLLQNRAEFVTRVKSCIAICSAHLYDDPPTDDPHYITFEKFDEDVHGIVLERIRCGKQMDSTTPPLPGSNNGLSWVKEGDFKPLSLE